MCKNTIVVLNLLYLIRIIQLNSMAQQNEELIKRISKLVKQNQELIEHHERLTRENDKLQAKIENFKAILADLKDKGAEIDESMIDRQRSLKFKMATVLFANIHGFSRIADGMDSEKMMDGLDQVLWQFDELLKKYNIHKIKTIGDSYMCAGGIPVKNITNPVQVVLAALMMQQYLDDLQKNGKSSESIWELKIGIHTGTVTADMVGRRKVSYDIKGDTVNIASRMESSGEVGKILVSVMSYELVKEFFICEYYGKLPVKYKGDLEMFEVKGLRPEFSEGGLGRVPNDMFETKFKLIQFIDIQEMILDKLEKELPGYLYYHNVKHTVDVVTEVELIGWAEGCTDHEILLLKTAGLFHDAGHTIDYDGHEELGCNMAKDFLPKYGYTDEQIEKICEIIMATKMPPKPETLLQRIICDSDLDYLGRSDMIPVSNTLYKELKEQDKIGTPNDWNKLQIKFISVHQYFTETARSLREVNKQMQIERIKKLIVEE
ncbi:MAG TPA: HD domain-containing protein [Bacteroides sp.]|nr:HD domain-containing protein [Bacteroides sp.]